MCIHERDPGKRSAPPMAEALPFLKYHLQLKTGGCWRQWFESQGRGRQLTWNWKNKMFGKQMFAGLCRQWDTVRSFNKWNLQGSYRSPRWYYIYSWWQLPSWNRSSVCFPRQLEGRSKMLPGVWGGELKELVQIILHASETDIFGWPHLPPLLP